MGVCYCSMFCCTLLYVHSSIAIILMRKRELIALLNLSSWCLVMVEWLFLAVQRGCLQFVIVVFPDHTHFLFFMVKNTHLLNGQLLLKLRKRILKYTLNKYHIYIGFASFKHLQLPFSTKIPVTIWQIVYIYTAISPKNSKWVWSGNTTITSRRQPRGTARKSRTTITRHQEDKLSKATSSLFPIKMIAILEWT